LIPYIFLVSETVFEILKKKLFKKKNFVCYGFQKRLELGQIVFFFFFFFDCWESSLPWTAQSRQCYRKIRGCFFFFLDIPNSCICKNVGDIKTNVEVLRRLRSHFLNWKCRATTHSAFFNAILGSSCPLAVIEGSVSVCNRERGCSSSFHI